MAGTVRGATHRPEPPTGSPAHRTVVVGGGFGGLQAALHLRHAGVQVTLVDERNYHLFQPLTYQVATGALAAAEIAYPLRAVFKRSANVRVLMARVTGFDLDARRVQLEPAAGASAPASLPYDTLIVAAGSTYSYFGHEDWRDLALEVKTLENAISVRGRILSAFEAAEAEEDPGSRRRLLTFVVVGGGPTGVEMAGQIAELARNTLTHDFRAIDPRQGRVLLIEATQHILGDFAPSLSSKAVDSLAELGVETMLGRAVVDIDTDGVVVQGSGDGSERIDAGTVVWAAGVTASSLAGMLGELTGAEVDRAGRVAVEPDLTLPGHSEVFALGDMVRVRRQDGRTMALPGVAPVAMQQGRYAARAVRARVAGEPTRPFRYLDKGNLATIGRARAVAEVRRLRLSGLVAWVVWLVVHIWYLIGFQNRVVVMVRWAYSFLVHGRGARIILEPGRAASADRTPLTRRP
jgi:NADH:ubiquinone reductase (H+-translocating)